MNICNRDSIAERQTFSKFCNFLITLETLAKTEFLRFCPNALSEMKPTPMKFDLRVDLLNAVLAARSQSDIAT